MELKNINLSDISKFAASTAVIYTSAFLNSLYIAHKDQKAFYAKNGKFKSALYLVEDQNTLPNLYNLKYQLAKEVLFTVGAYKLVDSVFEFDSVHSKAGMSAAAGAIGGLVDIDTHTPLPITTTTYQYLEAFPGIILLKAGTAAALAYINYDYSENKAEEILDFTNTDEQGFDTL